MNRFLLLLPLIFAFSCGGSGPAPDPVVVWPDLESLHAYQEEAHEFLHEEREDEARSVVAKILEKIPALVAAGPPSTVHNGEAVMVLLGDVGSLANNPDFDPAKLSRQELDDFVHVLHINLAKLMDTAGMPHVHDHE